MPKSLVPSGEARNHAGTMRENEMRKWGGARPRALSSAQSRGPRPRRAVRVEDGVTLIEILVALSILFAILIPLMGAYDWSMGQTSNTNQLTAAANLAGQALEQARAAAAATGGFPVAAQTRAAVAGTPYQLSTTVSTNTTMNWETITANVYLGSATTALVTLTTVVGP